MAKKKKHRVGIRESAIGLGLLAAAGVLIALLCVLAAQNPGGVSANAGYNTTVTAESPVRFSEVMASNASALLRADGSLPDWIELENTGSADVSLSGYVIMANGDPTQMYRFSGTTIAAGDHLVVYADGRDASKDGGIHLPFKIASSGETLTLLNAAGQAVDSIQTPPLEADQVYCRDGAGAWQISFASTPGEANRVAESAATQTAELTIEDSGIVITEVMSRNATYAADENGEYYDYVELTNVSNAEVSLKGWFLSDDLANVARWQFPEVSIPAGGSLIVHCSGYDRKDPAHLHASFRLNGDGTQVILTRGDGRTASMVEVPTLETDQAYSLVDNSWTLSAAPTPGMANTQESAAMVGESIRQINPEGVIINEIAAAASGSTPDWIELYNSGSTAVDLSGWGLSDNASRPRKWQFPEGITIQPGQYAAVFCSGEDKVEGGKVYTNFSLSADGGYSLTLSHPDGTIVDRIYVPQQYEGVTYGRVEGVTGLRFFSLATPLARNDGVAYMGKAPSPTYSVRGGMFTTGETVSVEMTSAVPNARIYYTLDSSDPDESDTLYTGPIEISATTILRTRVYADSYLESFMDTQSYLFDVNNGGGVYVISLVSDPVNLTSEETGIMVKGPNASKDYPYTGANFWQDWEREAHVEIYGGDGSELLSQGCGIKLHGQYSRAENQQAFKVIARTKYGSSRFPIALFSNRDYTEYQSFILRSSGQDTDKTRMRDSILSALAADTSVLYQETEICVLYLDGQYWGQYNIRERINPESICQFEGWEGDEDDIDLVKANTNTMQGSNETFAALLAAVKKADPTTDAFYENLDQAIDIQNFIEYMAVEIFTGNTDTLNVKRYRNANADGKWRWVLFDFDWAFTTDTNSINRWLTPGGMGANSRTDNTLFIACMKNPRFRDEFLTHMGQEMATTFSTENVVRMIRERYEILEPLLPEQLARWNTSAEKYQKELKFLINYAVERPMKLLKYFSTTEYLKMTTEEMYKYFGEALEVAQNYGA